MTGDPGFPSAPDLHRWCGDDPVQTRLLEAMSLLAPEVERFVIDAVRDALRGVEAADPRAAAGRSFMREEAAHSASHHAFNRVVLAREPQPERLLRVPRAIESIARARLPLRWRLCVASAAEHLSAVVSRLYLDSAARQAIADPAIRVLFDRHAIEEIAHRAVVFDIARAAGTNGFAARALALSASVVVGLLCLAGVMLALGRGGAGRPRAGRGWVGGLKALRASGWVRPLAVLAATVRYLRPQFHPSAPGAA